MSLTIKHLNDDTTFFLVFTPLGQPVPPNARDYPPGTFTVLIDPWLDGTVSMWHRKFLLSRHSKPCSIQHLSEIPEPNVVLVTQDKPDHCHEETLRHLDPLSPVTMVLAEKAAAKRIRGFGHFDPQMVHDLRPFSRKDGETIIRFCIPAIVPDGIPGEATIAFIPSKMDVAGVHNAVGITYRAPSTTAGLDRPASRGAPVSFRQSHGFSHSIGRRPLTPPESPGNSASSQSSSARGSEPESTFSLPSHTRSMSSTSSLSSIPSIPQTQKSLSVIYSPHGISYSNIRPYASSHLVANAALPLTALLHCFDHIYNPWWMGGNVAAGMTAGSEIARSLMARSWISAHDEEKETSGVSIKNSKITKYTVEEVLEKMTGSGTRVMSLGVGEELTMKV